ncbi:MAG: host attachment protein [Alphaproteobacteria bacterium]
MPRRKKTTWVVIADGARARIVATEGPRTGLAPLREMESTASRMPTRELGVERPGRAFESADVLRHAMEPRVDWHRFEKEQFAKSVAAIVDDAAGRRRFDALILVAPPRTLGDLRKALAQTTRAKVTAELAKDLTNVPLHELPRHLGGVVRCK